MPGADPGLLSQLMELGGRPGGLGSALGSALGPWQVLAVLGTTLGALALLNTAAPRLGLVDHPDGVRKRHARPVPLTGGLAILLGAGLGAMIGITVGAEPLDLFALLAIVTVIHSFDDQSAGDRPGLTPHQRLMIDAVVAMAFVVVTGEVIRSVGTVAGVPLELGIAAAPFTILIYLALTNAYNMIDGLDGLALSQFLIAFLGVGLWHLGEAGAVGLPPTMLPIMLASFVVLAANIGLFGRFLHCFLGDSGARLLGFFLVYLLVADGGARFSPPGALFFVALPLIDLCAVFAERLGAGGSTMRADRRHLHHLLVDAGLAPHLVVLVMGLASVGFIALHALMHLAGLGDLAIALAFVALAGLYLVTRRRLARAAARALAPRAVIGPAE